MDSYDFVIAYFLLKLEKMVGLVWPLLLEFGSFLD